MTTQRLEHRRRPLGHPVHGPPHGRLEGARPFTSTAAPSTIDEAELTASAVGATIDASSIDTGTPKRDDAPALARLLRRGALSRDRVPQPRIDKLGGRSLPGDRRPDHPRQDARGLARRRVRRRRPRIRGATGGSGSSRGDLGRKEFGLNWNQVLETGGVLVGDRVDIELEVQAVRAAAAKAA